MSDSVVLASAKAESPSRTIFRPSRSTVSMGLAAVINQSIFSLGNFASTVIVGKLAGETELGIYALAMSAVYLATALQRAIVSAPYTVQIQSLAGEQRNARRGSAFVKAVIVSSILCIFVAALRGLGLVLLDDFRVAATLLVCVTASWGIRDFCRRVMFADLRFREAVVFDGLIVAIQLSCLYYFVTNEMLTASTALQAIAWPSAIITAGWLLRRKSDFCVVPSQLTEDFRASWKYGRWSTLTEGVFAGQDFAIQTLLAATSSFATTGVYAACMSIVKLTNPLVYALGNVVGPRSAQTLHEGGPPKLVVGVRRVAWFVTAVMIAYLALVFFAGERLLDLLYGSAYAGKQMLLIILSLAAACTALGMAPAKGISAMEKPQLNLMANTAGFAVVLTAAWFSFEPFGVYGVANAILAGAIICCLCKWYLFRTSINRLSDNCEAV